MKQYLHAQVCLNCRCGKIEHGVVDSEDHGQFFVGKIFDRWTQTFVGKYFKT